MVRASPTAQFTHNFWNFYITPFIITERYPIIIEKKHQTYQHQSKNERTQLVSYEI